MPTLARSTPAAPSRIAARSFRLPTPPRLFAVFAVSGKAYDFLGKFATYGEAWAFGRSFEESHAKMVMSSLGDDSDDFSEPIECRIAILVD